MQTLIMTTHINKSAILLLPLILLALLPVSAAKSDNLGLLLTTPEERLAIQELRKHKKRSVTTHTPSDQEITTLSNVRYNGITIDSHGKTNYWVNGRQIKTPRESEQLGLSFPSDIKQGLKIKPINSQEKPVFIQPGERYNRQIPVTPPPPKDAQLKEIPIQHGSANKN